MNTVSVMSSMVWVDRGVSERVKTKFQYWKMTKYDYSLNKCFYAVTVGIINPSYKFHEWNDLHNYAISAINYINVIKFKLPF